MAVKTDKPTLAFLQGESKPRLPQLFRMAASADPEWIRNRLDEVRPEDANLDPATFNEVRRALLADLCGE